MRVGTYFAIFVRRATRGSYVFVVVKGIALRFRIRNSAIVLILVLFYLGRANATSCAGSKVLSGFATYSDGVVISPYRLPTHRSTQSKALWFLQHYLFWLRTWRGSLPLWVGDEFNSVRAEVHSPEGVIWILFAKDRNAMVFNDHKSTSATVGDLTG